MISYPSQKIFIPELYSLVTSKEQEEKEIYFRFSSHLTNLIITIDENKQVNIVDDGEEKFVTWSQSIKNFISELNFPENTIIVVSVNYDTKKYKNVVAKAFDEHDYKTLTYITLISNLNSSILELEFIDVLKWNNTLQKEDYKCRLETLEKYLDFNLGISYLDTEAIENFNIFSNVAKIYNSHCDGMRAANKFEKLASDINNIYYRCYLYIGQSIYTIYNPLIENFDLIDGQNDVSLEIEYQQNRSQFLANL